MNRNMILAVAMSLLVGVWGGLVLARVGGGEAPAVLDTAADGGVLRDASAPRPGLASVEGMAFTRLRIDTSAETPTACLEFSQPLSTDREVPWADFIRLEPQARFTAEASGQLLCLAGLPYDVDRDLTIRQGLPSASGDATDRDETIRLSFGDRPSFVGFAGNGVILPRTEADGLGIETVNVSRLKITVLRVSDRILPRETIEPGESVAEGSWYGWSFENAGAENGVKVYEGVIDVALGAPGAADDRRNQRITTVFPLGPALKTLETGAYVVKAEDASPSAGLGGQQTQRTAAAHRWILYTDMALQTFTGAHGMDAVVRSLQTARPMAGVSLTLVAWNNDVLARGRSDAQGRVRLARAALDGEGPQRPRYLMAYGPNGDFTVLDLDRPTLDLADERVGGRVSPGGVDAYMYTDRGVYRPGETVRVAGMLRDAAGRAIVNRPSVLVVYRPNGSEARRERLTAAVDAGAIVKNVALDRGAPRGRWRAVLEVDGQKAPAGEAFFAVEDFVPQRLRLTAEAGAAPLGANQTRPIAVNAQFLYGAPGAGLAIQGEARLQVDPNPFPAHQGFVFGDEQESFDERFLMLDDSVTDGAGQGQLLFALKDIPQTSLPLSALVVAAVVEPGGRTVRESVRLPVRLSARYLGVKPRFEGGRIDAGGSAAFEVIAVAPDGRRTSGRVAWTLVEEDWSYDWYLDDGQWRWRRTGRDIPVAAGVIDVGAQAAATIAREQLKDGAYRLVLTDEAAGARTSYRFGVGWGGPAEDGDTPDEVAVVAPTDPARAGSRVRLRIQPPYAGEAQIVVATDRVLEMRTVTVPAGGANLDLRVNEDWGAGAYVLVTVMTPRDPAALPRPRRAVGVAYVPVDMSRRTLNVSLGEGLGTVRPNARLDVPVRVAGVPNGERVRMTLAAVDEGILQLTKFESPDPTKHYFGKRALGVDLRDDYGRLLDPNLGAPAVPRQGGDGLGGEGLDTVPTKTVALWTGLVEVRGGRAVIPLDIPDFNGELRLMAVAWSEQALGAASAPVTVRDPVVAELTLPRFLAPGDEAFGTLLVDNVDGPAGTYTVSLSGRGAARINATQRFTLAPKARQIVRVPLAAGDAGLGQVSLALDGPQNLRIARSYPIQTRTPFLSVSDTQVATQAPGARFTLASEALTPFAAGEGRALVSYSAIRGVDPAAVIDVLQRYPYGCTEQLVSVAMPLLYANRFGVPAQTSPDPKLNPRLQEAITRLLDRQGPDGAFGLWRADDGAASPWLGVYVTDFLWRARQAGLVVPQQPLENAYRALRGVARLDDFSAVPYNTTVYEWRGNPDTERLLRSRSAAYALYVLARAGRADLGQLRYFHDARLREEPSPLARAQIGAALARLGDRARARSAFRMAEQALGYRNAGDWYQSPVRDLAGVLALAAEAGETELVDRLARRLEREAPAPEELMTQEQAHLLLAADALAARAGDVRVTLGDEPLVSPAAFDRAALATPAVFANAGQGQVFRTLTLSGPPRTPPPAVSDGFRIEKRLFRLDGALADADQLTQGDRVVVVLTIRPSAERTHPALVVDLLPAGLEIETVLRPSDGVDTFSGRGGAFAWVGEIGWTKVSEARDDRFVAAADMQGGRDFTVAYVARAVTPGRFVAPGAQVEDMYRPSVVGRTASGRVRVAPSGG